MKTIYALHERGAVSHFYALEALAEKEGYTLVYREFDLRKGLTNFLFKWNTKLFINIWFLLSLPFREPTKVVVGAAPYDSMLPLLMRLLKRHEVYYFTSYTCWNQTRHVHNPKGNKQLIEQWRYFTTTFVKHIFAVSNMTKEELVINGFATEDKITVVNHSIKKSIEAGSQTKQPSFIVVGRLIPLKGIVEIIEFFKQHPTYQVTFVGKGRLKKVVKAAAAQYENIHFAGYIKSFDTLSSLYKEHSFLLMNSQRTSGWEELFGIAIIEGMACGCLPIATSHTGPKEIIDNGTNGILYQEGKLAETIEQALALTEQQYSQMREQAIASAEQYYSRNIAERWRKVLS